MKRARRQVISRLAAWLTALAALGLLAQPASAAAMRLPHSQTFKIQLCSSQDSGQTLTVEIPAPPSDQADCHDCPACVVTPGLASAPVLAVAKVDFVEQAVTFAGPRQRLAPPATAPPRPFGQGPPHILDA